MANIRSAKKKVRKDLKRTKSNVVYKSKLDQVINTARKAAEAKDASFDVSKAYAVIDKAAKRNVISKQKATRLKSQVSKKK